MKSYRKVWLVVFALVLVQAILKLSKSSAQLVSLASDYEYSNHLIQFMDEEIEKREQEEKEERLGKIREEIAMEKKAAQEEAERQKKLEEERRREKKRYMVSRGLSIPEGRDTSFKSFMDYRKITNTGSEQYKLQRSSGVYTDKRGFRRKDDDYLVAVGSYYCNKVGDRLEITLDNGSKFTVMVGDIKADNHTDPTNRYRTKDGSVIEFIVDSQALDRTIKKMGDISYAGQELEGSIKSIKEIKEIN